MLPEVKKVVKSFVTESLTWKETRAKLMKKTQQQIKRLGFTTQTGGNLESDTFAVALSVFLTAMHKYLTRHIASKNLQWDSA